MMKSDLRNAKYVDLMASAGRMYAIMVERERANPHMNKAKELDKEAEELVNDVLPDVLSLVLSTVEAVHVLAEATADLASTYRQVNALAKR